MEFLHNFLDENIDQKLKNNKSYGEKPRQIDKKKKKKKKIRVSVKK